MRVESCNRFDPFEDRRLWKTKLRIPDGLNIREIQPTELRERLGLQSPDLEEVYRSALKNQWFDCDDGNFLIEIPNNERLQKKLGSPTDTSKSELVLLFDLDDTLLNTTAWHAKEQEIIRAYLGEQHIEANEQTVKELYELSKIFVPGVAEVQTRYTPILNMILIDQFIRRQKNDGFSSEEALTLCQAEHGRIQDRINTIGEGALRDYHFDSTLLSRILKENPIPQFMNESLNQDVFTEGPDGDDLLRTIITRGKIEGPLGQIYKVHSGDFTKFESLDMVIYTNDVKINALARVTNIFKELQSKQMILYDDNPSEIVPFLEQFEAQGMNPLKMEIVHVRLSDAKRRDKRVVIHDARGERCVDPEASFGYAYFTDEKDNESIIPIESFVDIPPKYKGTIFDHFSINSKGMSQVV